MHPFKSLRQINMEVWVLQQEKTTMTAQELHRRSLDISFDINTYINRQCYVLEYIWKSERVAWAAHSLACVFPECADAVTCVLQWLSREHGEPDAIEDAIRELVRDRHPVGFEELVLLTVPPRALAFMS
jgi:hypothetical protein